MKKWGICATKTSASRHHKAINNASESPPRLFSDVSYCHAEARQEVEGSKAGLVVKLKRVESWESEYLCLESYFATYFFAVIFQCVPSSIFLTCKVGIKMLPQRTAVRINGRRFRKLWSAVSLSTPFSLSPFIFISKCSNVKANFPFKRLWFSIHSCLEQKLPILHSVTTVNTMHITGKQRLTWNLWPYSQIFTESFL